MRPVPNSGELDAFGEPAGVLTREKHKGGERHSAKAHRCVDQVGSKGHDESSAWAICTSSMGKDKVYAKGHGGKARPKRKVHEAEMDALVEKWSDAARAASAAARRAKAKGKDWRRAARVTFKRKHKQERIPDATGFATPYMTDLQRKRVDTAWQRRAVAKTPADRKRAGARASRDFGKASPYDLAAAERLDQQTARRQARFKPTKKPATLRGRVKRAVRRFFK